jgi:hypothetical protein
MLETRRGDMPNVAPPPMPSPNTASPGGHMPQRGHAPHGLHATPAHGVAYSPVSAIGPAHPHSQLAPANIPMTYPLAQGAQYQQHLTAPTRAGNSNKIIWWVVGLLALGAAAGAILALVMR